MDNRRYQELRTYCMGELGEHMNLPGYEDVMHLWVKQNGPFGRIMREEYLARHLFQCIDLTTRERAAAYLLAVITNHRSIAWQREPSPPNGREQLPPLEKSEADELEKVTCDAVRRFAAFLPEPERAVLLADCEAAPIATEPQAAPVLPAGASDGVEPAKSGPLPVEPGLLTKEIADAFDGVNGWAAARWPRNLSAAKWLAPCRIDRGEQGGASAVWRPLLIAQLIHGKTKGNKEKEKALKLLNSRFTRIPALAPWRNDFNEYFATYCPVN